MTRSQSSPGKLVMLSPRWPPAPGGLAAAAARLAMGLAEHRPVRVIIPDPALPLGALRLEIGDGLEIHRFGARRRPERQAGFAACLAACPEAAVLHAVYPSETGRAALEAARRLGVPCVLAARGNDLDRDADRPGRGEALREALAGADAVVGVSRALTARAVALGARGRALTIPNGVSPTRFRPFSPPPGLASRLDLPVDAWPVLAFVGEARPKKGLDTMLAAFRLVRAARPTACLWLIGGLREDGEAGWEAFARDHPADAARVRLQHAVDPDDIPPLLGLATLGWHPSHQDGLPNALLESLACGLPTLASRVGGIPDVLDTPDLGRLLVPPGDAPALATVTLALVADEAARQALAAAGRARVVAAFSPEAEVAAYLALYATLGAP